MATFHLITVGDTNDENIGETVLVDLDRLPSTMLMAASAAGMQTRHIAVHGDDYSADNLQRALGSISAQPDDTVAFYYSGHGARGESKPDPWPVASLGWHSLTQLATFDLGSVYRTLRALRPRMLFVAVDCCQEEVPDDMIVEFAKRRRATRSATYARNAQALFSEFSGEVLLMSCLPGELSGCNLSSGGFFTNALLDSLEGALDGAPVPTWGNVASGAGELPADDQSPMWKVVASRNLASSAPGLEPFPGAWVTYAGTRRVTARRISVARAAAAQKAQKATRGIAAVRRGLQAKGGAGPACRACGAPLRPNVHFCGKCGHAT